MAVKVVKREYENKFRGEKTNFLLGNSGDKIRLELDVDFFGGKRFATSNILLLENSGKKLILSDGTTWNEYGFDVGDSIICYYRFTELDQNGNTINGTPSDLPFNKTIVSIDGDEMEIDTSFVDFQPIMPYSDNNGTVETIVDNVAVFGVSRPEGIEFNYGFLSNDNIDTLNINSLIDGTLTRLVAENTDSLNNGAFSVVGFSSGMSILRNEWLYVGSSIAIDGNTFHYRFIIEFVIDYIFNEINDFSTLIAPDTYFEQNSLTDSFRINGLMKFNNPNVVIKNDQKSEKKIGNVGWFNENYNDLGNNLSVTSVQYTDVLTGDIVSELSFADEVKIDVVIDGVQNLSNGNTKLAYGFSMVNENEDYYKENNNLFAENMYMNIMGDYSQSAQTPSNSILIQTFLGMTNEAGTRMDVKNPSFVIDGNGDLVFSCIFSPTIGYFSKIQGYAEEDRNYIIWLSASDHTKETGNSDRVSLLLDFNQLKKKKNVVGEYSPMKTGFIEHEKYETEDVNFLCNNNFIVEDGVLCKTEFSIDYSKPIPSRIDMVIEVQRGGGEVFELEKQSVDLTIFPVDANGVIDVNYDEEKGYNLISGNSKNWVKIVRNTSKDFGDLKGYTAYFGMKIRWEDWISKTGVPSDFYDNNLQNDGLNNDWHHYFISNDWQIYYTNYMYIVNEEDELDVYRNKNEFKILDYDDNLDVSVAFNYFNAQNVNVNNGTEDGKTLGVINENETIRIEAIFTRSVGSWNDLSGVYCVIGYETFEGSGELEYRELSSIVLSEQSNPLKPLQGQTFVKLTLLNSTNIKAECLLDYSLMNSNENKHKISARIGCK